MVQFEEVPVAKRPKTSHPATQPASSAVARFFATPELVLIVLENLLAERIDLLIVASVCKRLRAPALQTWVRNLDFRHDSFEGKLEFLQANTHLLAHIRCLRIFNCDWFDVLRPHFERPPSFWDQVKTMFSLLATHTPPRAAGPLLDIVIDVEDGDALYQALQPYPKLAQRISALRLNDQSVRASDTDSTTTWMSLTLLLKDALPRISSAENLRVVEYECQSLVTDAKFRRAAKRIFWSTLAAQCRSLSKIGLLVTFGDEINELFLHGSFPSLKTFELRDVSKNKDLLDVEAVHTFLDRHTGLERLRLERYDTQAWSLGLTQTFPALQDLQLPEGISLLDEANLEFVRRHSRLRRLVIWKDTRTGQFSPMRSLFLSKPDTFKHLPSAENASVTEINALIKIGARPSRAEARLTKPATDRTGGSGDDNRFSDLGILSWEGVRPEGVEDLTFLQVTTREHLDGHDQHFRQLFASDLFPNLTELHFELRHHGEGAFPTLDVLFRHLASSISLRVLGIFPVVRQEFPTMLLTRHVFPIRFELLCWSQDFYRRFDYFRFVADSTETQDFPSTSATQVGKMGRLQAVPAHIILTQVGSDGVWYERSDVGVGIPRMTFLNHNGV
ncbi:unnamed protein product [Tilletia laevis]|uniref:Uncharacterized protein n=4 Tax=Tilletia TaxID=13289 RepID=A0A8X7MYI3_9BASI|nr:hypothetical protein CF336_g1585 [Tilletia laevis]KAE8203620.1 hypothetical protein CF328_g1556 [Tilletia controversa]KAE8252735.1 hypothetical protein A4X06_0g1969 [Tilletia controversa]CAD6923235.1 unnamed protein product [Tilletia laevis]CAD6980845.1 unnamed protein product [Tilletia controversa]